MKTGVMLGLLCLLLAATASAQVRVKGYIKKDGTYVAPHYRSAPNSSRSDNYSSRDNYNPYTGEKGSTNPYAAPSYRFQTSRSYAAPAPQYPQPSPSAAHYRAEEAFWVQQREMHQAHARAQQQQAQASLASAQATLAADIASGSRNPKSLSAMEIALYQFGAPRQFHGDGCTDDCSGHEAGYEWAEDNDITDPGDCGGNSQSFIEGCEAWAEENGQ